MHGTHQVPSRLHQLCQRAVERRRRRSKSKRARATAPHAQELELTLELARSGAAQVAAGEVAGPEARAVEKTRARSASTSTLRAGLDQHLGCTRMQCGHRAQCGINQRGESLLETRGTTPATSRWGCGTVLGSRQNAWTTCLAHRIKHTKVSSPRHRRRTSCAVLLSVDAASRK